MLIPDLIFMLTLGCIFSLSWKGSLWKTLAAHADVFTELSLAVSLACCEFLYLDFNCNGDPSEGELFSPFLGLLETSGAREIQSSKYKPSKGWEMLLS